MSVVLSSRLIVECVHAMGINATITPYIAHVSWIYVFCVILQFRIECEPLWGHWLFYRWRCLSSTNTLYPCEERALPSLANVREMRVSEKEDRKEIEGNEIKKCHITHFSSKTLLLNTFTSQQDICHNFIAVSFLLNGIWANLSSASLPSIAMNMNAPVIEMYIIDEPVCKLPHTKILRFFFKILDLLKWSVMKLRKNEV